MRVAEGACPHGQKSPKLATLLCPPGYRADTGLEFPGVFILSLHPTLRRETQ